MTTHSQSRIEFCPVCGGNSLITFGNLSGREERGIQCKECKALLHWTADNDSYIVDFWGTRKRGFYSCRVTSRCPFCGQNFDKYWSSQSNESTLSCRPCGFSVPVSLWQREVKDPVTTPETLPRQAVLPNDLKTFIREKLDDVERRLTQVVTNGTQRVLNALEELRLTSAKAHENVKYNPTIRVEPWKEPVPNWDNQFDSLGPFGSAIAPSVTTSGFCQVDQEMPRAPWIGS